MPIDLPAVCAALGLDAAGAHATPLATGAYHEHVVLQADGEVCVLRRCTGSQWGLEPVAQLAREHATLQALHEASPGTGPRPLALLGELLVEELVEGRPFDYATDLAGLGAALAAVHAVPAPAHLPSVDPVAALAADGLDWLERAPASEAKALLAAHAATLPEHGPPAAAVLCHTDVNPGNLLVAGDGRVRLVDWEAARGGDAAWDLAHALSPTTTCWSDDAPIVLDGRARAGLLRAYLDAGGDPDAVKRVALLHAAVVFRALAWCLGFDARAAPALAPRLRRLRDANFVTRAIGRP